MRAAALLVLGILAAGFAGCTVPEPQPRARPGDFVLLDLVVLDPQGRELRNASGLRAVMASDVPTRLPEGWDPRGVEPVPPALVHALSGAIAGASAELRAVPPGDAYGNRSSERTIRAPLADALPREQRVQGAAILESFPPQVVWANHTWTIDLLGQNGSEARVWLNETPPVGTRLELPDYWNEHYQLWRSAVTGGNATHILLRHEPVPGTVSVGGVPHAVRVEGGEAVADGNHPLAGMVVGLRATLREVVFPGSAAFPPAPDAVLVVLDGSRRNVSDLRGKPALLDFFATWCVTCQQQAPILARAREQYGDNLTIVSITIDPTDTPDRIRAFQAEAERASRGLLGRPLPADWVFAFDPTGEAARGFSVTGIPREVLLDADGRIRATSVGLHPWEELRRELAELGE